MSALWVFTQHIQGSLQLRNTTLANNTLNANYFSPLHDYILVCERSAVRTLALKFMAAKERPHRKKSLINIYCF